MQKLVRGVQQFQKTVFGQKKNLFEELAKGQNPGVLFITCSDSRLDPNMLTQTQPGDVFIMRNAGNIIPPYGTTYTGESGSIEFAVSVLNVQDIIICGHSHCGAMKGVLHPEAVKDLPAVAGWLRNADGTQKIMQENYSHLEGDALLNATIQENVLAQIENIRTHPSVMARLARGELNIHGWVYKFETGEVFSYDSKQEQFVHLKDALVPSVMAKRRVVAGV